MKCHRCGTPYNPKGSYIESTGICSYCESRQYVTRPMKPKRKRSRTVSNVTAGVSQIGYLWDQDPHCFYCHRKLRRDEATRDHYIPKSRGGTSELSNIRVACFKCNNLKGDMMPDDFLALMEATT